MTDPTQLNPFTTAEKASEQVREYTERATGTGKAVGNLALDTYEQAVNTLVQFEQKAAEASPVDWVKTALGAHASFVGDVTAAYVRAARSALS